jgi:hypothetical protein
MAAFEATEDVLTIFPLFAAFTISLATALPG